MTWLIYLLMVAFLPYGFGDEKKGGSSFTSFLSPKVEPKSSFMPSVPSLFRSSTPEPKSFFSMPSIPVPFTSKPDPEPTLMSSINAILTNSKTKKKKTKTYIPSLFPSSDSNSSKKKTKPKSKPKPNSDPKTSTFDVNLAKLKRYLNVELPFEITFNPFAALNYIASITHFSLNQLLLDLELTKKLVAFASVIPLDQLKLFLPENLPTPKSLEDIALSIKELSGLTRLSISKLNLPKLTLNDFANMEISVEKLAKITGLPLNKIASGSITLQKLASVQKLFSTVPNFESIIKSPDKKISFKNLEPFEKMTALLYTASTAPTNFISSTPDCTLDINEKTVKCCMVAQIPRKFKYNVCGIMRVDILIGSVTLEVSSGADPWFKQEISAGWFCFGGAFGVHAACLRIYHISGSVKKVTLMICFNVHVLKILTLEFGCIQISRDKVILHNKVKPSTEITILNVDLLAKQRKVQYKDKDDIKIINRYLQCFNNFFSP